MSSSSSTPPGSPPPASTPPASQPSAVPAAAAPQASSPATAAFVSWRQWLQNLSPAVKGAFIVLLILILVVLYYFSGRVTTDDAQVDAHITAIAPQVPGYAVQLFINDNTPVQEGDLLVQVDPRTYQAEVDQAKANLDFAEAQANSAKLQIGLTRQTTTHGTNGAAAQKNSDAADYASSQAQLEQSATANLQVAESNVVAKKATNDRAQSDLQRYTPLLSTDDVSKFQYDAVDATARVAKSELEAAQQQLSAAQQSVTIARANTQSSQARLSRASGWTVR